MQTCEEFFFFFLTYTLSRSVLLISAVAELQRMFPTPPSLEQHPAFSPITTYRDTPSQETPAPSAGHEHPLNTHTNNQLNDYRSEMDESMTSPKAEDIRVCIQP